MDAALYATILSDKCITDLGKIRHKYPQADIAELIALLENNVFQKIPLPDFSGAELVYLENVAQVHMNAIKLLLKPQNAGEPYGLKAMEEEITSTLIIENIDFSRDSVRKILRGFAPADESEKRIFGLKQGLEFISDPAHAITEETIYELYMTAVGQSLSEEDSLRPGELYRHDSVYIVGQTLEHTGLFHKKLREHMAKLVAFIQADDQMNDLLKAAAIHFYIAYLHPYFDGNGRIARLIHLWYLRRQGYPSTLFIPFSSYIERSRKAYYNAYTLIEKNYKISGMVDITPFLVYFIENVYNQIDAPVLQTNAVEAFQKELRDGNVTEKERQLWNFVLSAYGTDEFSTKQLERDFGHAAYATIRSFVLKFEKRGLLSGQRYGNKVKYSVSVN